jgi:DNA processing protein
LWQRVEGIGEKTARSVCAALASNEARADKELARAADLGVRIIACDDEQFPSLLAPLPDAPALLYIKGELQPATDRFGVAIVGSRACTQYGLEQAGRFARALAQSGLTVVSGGARGVDTAAHRAALDVGARTIVVLGCGIDYTYPPENVDLFKRVASQGLVVSELPIGTAPAAENFPGRNRIIAGLSLGVLVIEAARGSGSLITAKDAVERYGREAMALPGRVDSPASQGSLDLIKQGGAAMVLDPGDCIKALEAPARQQLAGTLASKAAALHALAQHAQTSQRQSTPSQPPELFEAQPVDGTQRASQTPKPAPQPTPQSGASALPLSATARTLLGALGVPQTLDQLALSTGLSPSALRAELTLLEVSKRVRRKGDKVERVEGPHAKP